MNGPVSGAVELAYFLPAQEGEIQERSHQAPDSRKDLLNKPKSNPPQPRIAAAVVDEMLSQLARGM